jgi:hypothetical protein
MNRRREKSRPKPKPDLANVPRLHLRLARWLLSWPRALRMILVIAFALTVTIAFSPLVDNLYLSFFYTPATTVLPSIVSVALGLVMYVAGWRIIVGTVGETPAAQWAVLWYFGIGLLAVVLIIILVMQGISMGTAPM